ncbi:MAG: cytochrome c [Anaerolineae bacterium]|jgi:mono/diheme cytochrome c family protein|nr:cytochrome c [Anaerolineae bacterium]
MKSYLANFLKISIILFIGFGVLLWVGLFLDTQIVHALPEYAVRTDESCAACHVNPGGGGPRTLRGLLWAAQGQPDQMPELENILIAPSVSDGAELYDIACSSCHGQQGEGIFGLKLTGTSVKESKIRSNILRGRLRSGMPFYEGQFIDEQLDALVLFVTELSAGKAETLPDFYELPPAELSNGVHESNSNSGGN